MSIFSFLGFPKLATATTQNRPDLQQSFGEFSQKRCAKRRRDGFSLMFCLRFQKFFIKHPKVAMKMATLENLGCLFSLLWDFQSWQQQRCPQNRPDLQQSFGEFSQKRCAKRRRDGFLFDVLSTFPKVLY